MGFVRSDCQVICGLIVGKNHWSPASTETPALDPQFFKLQPWKSFSVRVWHQPYLARAFLTSSTRGGDLADPPPP